MKNNYSPNPLDTSQVRLPEDLELLVEKMARNVHEVWAAGRLADGWTWGPLRDDTLKHHPCLISYDELTETEREYPEPRHGFRQASPRRQDFRSA